MEFSFAWDTLTFGASDAEPKPGPSFTLNFWPATPARYRTSENPSGGSTNPRGATPAFAAGTKTVWDSGSYPAPGQLVPPPKVPIVSAPTGPGSLLTTAPRNIVPIL